MRHRRLWLYLCLFCLALLLTVLRRGEAAQATSPQQRVAGSLPITAPETARVGNAVTITVGPIAAPDNTPVQLVAVGSYGAKLYEAVLTGGTASFVMEPEDTKYSGEVTLLTSAGDAHGTANIILIPGQPVSPVTPLVGSRTIVADKEHWSITTVIPFDAFGNPVADGTPVTIRALHPEQNLEQQVVHVQHLVAWTRIYSGTRAGRTIITAQADTAFGPEAALLEVAGWPVPFTISADPRTLAANGRDLVVLRTDTIHDRFGNVVPDGTLVTFVVEEPDTEPRRIPAYTIHGQAEAQLQAPIQPGTAHVRGVVYSVESEPLRITFTAGPAVGTFPVAAEVSVERSAVILRAGPLLAQLEQFVPDGTPVSFVVTGPDGQQQELGGIADRGHSLVELRLTALAPGTYSVRASMGTSTGAATFTLPED